MAQAMIIILLFTLPVVAALRAVLGRRVQALMLERSPVLASSPPVSNHAPEVQASSALRTIRLDASSVSPEVDQARHEVTRPGRSLFRRWCAYDAAAVAAVFALWYLAQWALFGDGGALRSMTGPFAWTVGIYLTLVGLRYALHVGKYADRAIRDTSGPGWFRRWVSVGPEELFQVFTHPRYAWFPLAFIAYVTYSAGRTVPLAQFWIGLLVLLPLLLHARLLQSAQRAANRRLLLLRVFGRDESTALTFGAIRAYWQHVGSTFTVVDRSYIRYKYRGRSEQQVAVAFFACFGWALVFGTPAFNDWWGIALALSALLILGYGVALVVMYLRAPRSFATSPEQIRDRLQRFVRRPRRWDLTFKDLDMYCFDDTWQDAVAAFAAVADVVLMDLRGYSARNAGCRTEVNFLFDTVPVGRVVFLVDTQNDAQAVEGLVRDAWELLAASSPNLALADPTATIYDVRDGSASDVRGLMNILVARAAHRQAEPVAPADEPAGAGRSVWQPTGVAG